ERLKNDIEPKLHDAKVVYDTRKQDFEKQNESASKWAKNMRAQLQVGDVCPVCQQKINSELPLEKEIAVLVKGLKDAFAEAEKVWTDLDAEKNKCDAELKSQEDLHKSEKVAFDKDKNLEKAMDDALKLGKTFGVTSIDDKTQALIDDEISVRNGKLKTLNESIEKAEGVEKEVGKLRKSCEKLETDIKTAKNNVDTAQKALDDCKSAIDASNKVIAVKNSEITAAESNVNKHLGATTWGANWKTETVQFADELSNKAKDYAEKDKLYQTTIRKLETSQKDCNTVDEVIKDIVLLMSEWANLNASKSARLADVINKANNLHISVSNATTKKSDEAVKLAKAEAELEQWLSNHVDYQIADLSRLDAFDQNTIASKNKHLRLLQDSARECNAALEQILNQKKEHDDGKPEFEAEDTIESLDERIKAIKVQRGDDAKTLGAKEKQLKDDEENREKQQKLLDDVEKKEKECKRWEKLSSLLGSKEGDVFRRVAQSYILSGLVESANDYMKTLTDRYTLKVEPGTLIIAIEDAYQGFARRSASTISGGETFLVSLSLALALSDFGQGLAVDTLFIDEGFGTLSGEPLQKAIATLHSLHANSGRNVGIISHIEELQERIPVQIKVHQNGNSGNSM
ncbi:MAG: hypothetical protein HUK15_06815, partial [Bacteroidales bacterium]|nr:hypothetical protein [Bacteroidales bacterium]